MANNYTMSCDAMNLLFGGFVKHNDILVFIIFWTGGFKLDSI